MTGAPLRLIVTDTSPLITLVLADSLDARQRLRGHLAARRDRG